MQADVDHRVVPLEILVRQVRALTFASLKARYRKTFAGFFWVVLNPLIQYSVQAVIFSHVLRLGIDNYPLFLLSGLLPWILISSSLEMSCSSFLNSAEFLKSYQVHPITVLLSQLLDNVINFLVAFAVILIGVLVVSSASLSPWGVLLSPLAALPIIIGTGGLAYALATLQVFFRDVKFILGFMINITYFVTPIFYASHLLPENLRWIAAWNPIYILIRPFRIAIYSFDFAEFIRAWILSMNVAILFVVIAAVYWRRKKNEVYLFV